MALTLSESLLREMLKCGVHFGHKPAKWNPKMAPFIHGKHSGVHVFDLNQTAYALKAACDFLEDLTKQGKTVLFVGTKQQATRIVDEVAKAKKMPHITHKWVAGLLTNFSSIKKRIKYLSDLKERDRMGDFDKYTKKEALSLRKTITKLENALGGVSEMNKLPDALIVVDVVREKIAIREARKINIPVIALVDSNGNPEGINFPIPANDDAVSSIQFMVETLGNAIHTRS